MSRGRFGSIYVRKCDQESVRNAQEKPPEIDGAFIHGRDLDGARDGVQQAREPERDLAAEEMSEQPGNQGREESAQRQ